MQEAIAAQLFWHLGPLDFLYYLYLYAHSLHSYTRNQRDLPLMITIPLILH
jgi:hypothetical protein